MKKTIIFLLIGVLMPMAAFAERVLTRITEEHGIEIKIEYDQYGRLVRMSTNQDDISTISADWSKFNEGIVYLTEFSEDESLLLNVILDDKGRAVRVIEKLSNMTLYEFSYDTNNYITSIKTDFDEYVAEKNIVWENGNLVKITGKEINENGSSTAISVDIQYTDTSHPTPVENKGEIIGGMLSFVVDSDDMGVLNMLQMMSLIGNRPINLPFYAVSRWEGYPSSDFKFNYVFDSQGYPIEATSEEDGEGIHHYYTWGEIELGIEDAVSLERKAIGVYDINGVKLPECRKGLNIVRYSDGRCEKVVVK